MLFLQPGFFDNFTFLKLEFNALKTIIFPLRLVLIFKIDLVVNDCFSKIQEKIKT